MKKTDNFFVISNYNQDPSYLLDYCSDYVIYDQSDSDDFDKVLEGKKVLKSKHTGHNISDYFTYFIDNYSNLPEFMVLIKGNIINRHLSKEFFDRVYDNKYYTFLFEGNDTCTKTTVNSSFLSARNEYLELNNPWYIKYHPHRYFNNFNELLKFIYKDPFLPNYCFFSPGACYIVSKYQVLKNSKEFYKNLNKIISYTIDPKFPSEAHQIERMMHTIYTSNYDIQSYMNNEKEFDEKIEQCKLEIERRKLLENRLFNRIARKIKGERF